VKDPSSDKIVRIWVDLGKYAKLLARDDLPMSFVVEFSATSEVNRENALGLARSATDQSPTLEEILSA